MKVAVLPFVDEPASDYARLLSGRAGVDVLAAEPGAGTVGAAFAAGPDAVLVTGAPAGHRALVERAAAAGAHVLCAQPLAATEDDAVALLDACARAGTLLVMAGGQRCGPAFADARRLVADGALGTVLTVHGTYTAAPQPADDGTDAVVAALAVVADVVDGLLGGDPAVQVYAQLTAAEDAPRTAFVTVTYRSGTTAAFDVRADGSAAGRGPLVTVYGTAGSVEFEPYGQLLGGFDAAAGRERWETEEGALRAEALGRFLDAASGAAGGAAHGLPDGAAGLRVLRILLAARHSARTGRPGPEPD
jgi:predicted dehydrogenase